MITKWVISQAAYFPNVARESGTRSIEGVFGSKARYRTLAVLANAYGPLSGYRIAQTAGIPASKVHVQLHSLARLGTVRRGRDGWVLEDSDLRALFRKRAQLRAWDDWRLEMRSRESERSAVLARLREMPATQPPSGWTPREPARFSRSPGKDRLLKRMGLREALDGQQD
jgi:hypothetical protein